MAGDIVAFSPPLIISEAELTELLTRFERALEDTTAWIKTWSN
jgi:4-aminobutyrate--pyruvate transaminase